MPYFGLPLQALPPSLHGLTQRCFGQEEYLILLGWKWGSQSSLGDSASFDATLVPRAGSVQWVRLLLPSWGAVSSDPSGGHYHDGKCY